VQQLPPDEGIQALHTGFYLHPQHREYCACLYIINIVTLLRRSSTIFYVKSNYKKSNDTNMQHLSVDETTLEDFLTQDSAL